jgi:phosphoserine aminotransferase
MTPRVYNFSPGPATLPEPVLAEVQRDLLSLPGVGASILEISHRSRPFENILHQTNTNLRQLLAIPDDYIVLFLQGGSRLQFSMVPMNLAGGTRQGEGGDGGPSYLVSGTWGKYAAKEAEKLGKCSIVWDGAKTKYDRLPKPDEVNVDARAAYLHFTSNETIEGVQFATEPACGKVSLVCDASSDFLSRPLNVRKYGMIYACAQKNAGPAGVTVVILHKDLMARSSDSLPGYMNYRLHAENDSLWNTPPTFAIYVMSLVTKWLLTDIGGLEQMRATNERKAKMLYEVIDGSDGFYSSHARADFRSIMNVVFRLPSDNLTEKFAAAAAEHGLTELKGHRSVGGIRASIYNAMPVEGVERLRDFMVNFKKKG